MACQLQHLCSPRNPHLLLLLPLPPPRSFPTISPIRCTGSTLPLRKPDQPCRPLHPHLRKHGKLQMALHPTKLISFTSLSLNNLHLSKSYSKPGHHSLHTSAKNNNGIRSLTRWHLKSLLL